MRWTYVAGVIAVAALAGCSSSGSSGNTGTTTGTTSGATAGATSGTATGTGATSGSTGSSTGTSGGGTASGTSSCATSDLKAKLGPSQGAAGSVYVTLEFTNVSGHACTLYGYPGVSLTSGSAQVSPGADRSPASAKKLVTLDAGSTASATLQIGQAANYPASTCAPKPTSDIKIYPPNQTAALYAPLATTACTKPVHQLTISAVQPGS